MTNSYWNSNGTHQAIADKLQEMVPTMGEVFNIPGDETSGINKPVDKFREAMNAYYDIFNNGGGNSVSRKVSTYFPGVMSIINRNYRNIDWDAVHAITEPMMDLHILKASKKANI